MLTKLLPDRPQPSARYATPGKPAPIAVLSPSRIAATSSSCIARKLMASARSSLSRRPDALLEAASGRRNVSAKSPDAISSAGMAAVILWSPSPASVCVPRSTPLARMPTVCRGTFFPTTNGRTSALQRRSAFAAPNRPVSTAWLPTVHVEYVPDAAQPDIWYGPASPKSPKRISLPSGSSRSPRPMSSRSSSMQASGSHTSPRISKRRSSALVSPSGNTTNSRVRIAAGSRSKTDSPGISCWIPRPSRIVAGMSVSDDWTSE